jgi:hypothetical protein
MGEKKMRKLRLIIATATTAGLALAAAGAALADPCPKPASHPTVTMTTTDTDTNVATYQGFSTQPQHSPDGQGTSSITQELTTTTTTTYQHPPGNADMHECETSTTSDPIISYSFDGPGNSPDAVAEKLLGDRVCDAFDPC